LAPPECWQTLEWWPGQVVGSLIARRRQQGRVDGPVETGRLSFGTEVLRRSVHRRERARAILGPAIPGTTRDKNNFGSCGTKWLTWCCL